MRVVYVDAFTAQPFGGNPAAVVLVAEAHEDAWLQALARELNLPATAVVHRVDDDAFQIRWFSPATELALCGHGTLASAHVLWQDGVLTADQSPRFESQAGPLSARRDDGWIELDFPAARPSPCTAPPGLFDALGVPPRAVASNRLDHLVELESETAVRTLTPDLALLATVETRGVIVTAPSDSPPFDFVSRFFAPRVGIAEDPATGSAHCCLGPYWEGRLGRSHLLAHQVSARGGVLRVTVRGDRVGLAGQAVTVRRGRLVWSESRAGADQ